MNDQSQSLNYTFNIMESHRQVVHGWSHASWGTSDIFVPKSRSDLCSILDIAKQKDLSIAIRGAGRSYDDSAVNHNGILLDCSKLNRILEFDSIQGTIRVETGVTIEQILKRTLPEGWVFPATPGTKFVSVGGALSNNIHGKNCLTVGNIGESVLSFLIMLADGQIVECSRTKNEELFFSAIGGLGLLGIIVEAHIQLNQSSSSLSVESVTGNSIEEIISLMESRKGQKQYFIAQVDGFKNGRGLLKTAVETNVKATPKRNIEVKIKPQFLKLITALKYHIDRKFAHERTTNETFEDFTFLMDRRIPNYNKYYRNGFYEYQALIPSLVAPKVFRNMLEMAQAAGIPSCMTGVKPHRKSKEDFLFQFALDGYSITMDFIRDDRAKPLFAAFNKLVIENIGMIYLAKTTPLSWNEFLQMYPAGNKFLELKRKYDPYERFQSNFYRRIMKSEKHE